MSSLSEAGKLDRNEITVTQRAMEATTMDTRYPSPRNEAGSLSLPTDDFPLRVVPDWDAQVQRAGELCRLIDRHLDFEAGGRLLKTSDDFRPQHLCPEQRVQMLTDLHGAVRRRTPIGIPSGLM